MKLTKRQEIMGETVFTRLFLTPICIIDFGRDEGSRELFIIDSKEGRLGRYLIFRLYGYFLCFIKPKVEL